MTTETVCADWLHDQVFLLHDHNGFEIGMAQPNGANGADLLPLSLIGCAAWDIMSILHKQRQAVTGLRVSADSERDNEPPWRFQKIHITYHFRGKGLNESHLRRAIQLSEEKYCSVYATLRAAVEITSSLDIVNDPA